MVEASTSKSRLLSGGIGRSMAPDIERGGCTHALDHVPCLGGACRDWGVLNLRTTMMSSLEIAPRPLWQLATCHGHARERTLGSDTAVPIPKTLVYLTLRMCSSTRIIPFGAARPSTVSQIF
eukprot:2628043-Rhodomonas_salina.1